METIKNKFKSNPGCNTMHPNLLWCKMMRAIEIWPALSSIVISSPVAIRGKYLLYLYNYYIYNSELNKDKFSSDFVEFDSSIDP